MMERLIEFLNALLSTEIFAEVLASMSLGVLIAALVRFLPFVRRSLGVEKSPEPESYSRRLAKLTQDLTKASVEVDSLLAELAQVARERQNTVGQLGRYLAELEQRKARLEKRIEELEDVPIPAAEHFATLVQSGEKRSAWRDYVLFGAGVVVSIIVSLLIR